MTPSRRPTRATYRRRRAVALLAVLALVAVAGFLLHKTFTGAQRATLASQRQAPQPSVSPTVSPTAGRTGPAVRPGGPCNPSDVSVTPSVAGAKAVAGRPVTITLTFTTRGSTSCTWQVSSATVVLKVNTSNVQGSISGVPGGSSGDVWSTQECAQAMPAASLTLVPSTPAPVTVSWQPFPSSGGSGCPGTSSWMYPGAYTAIAAAAGGLPASGSFQLTAPVAQTITRTASPSPTAKASPTTNASPTAKPTAKSTKKAHG